MAVYVCPICGRQYKSRDGLHKHAKRVHGLTYSQLKEQFGEDAIITAAENTQIKTQQIDIEDIINRSIKKFHEQISDNIDRIIEYIDSIRTRVDKLEKDVNQLKIGFIIDVSKLEDAIVKYSEKATEYVRNLVNWIIKVEKILEENSIPFTKKSENIMINGKTLMAVEIQPYTSYRGRIVHAAEDGYIYILKYGIELNTRETKKEN